MGIQTDVVDDAGVLLGVVVEDLKRGGFVALLTFEFLIGDQDYDQCWRVGSTNFPSLEAADAAVRISHNVFKNRRQRIAEHDRLLSLFVANEG